MHPRAALLLALAFGPAGCSGDDPGLFVQMKTDLAPGVELDTLLVELRDDRGRLGEVLRSTEVGIAASQDFRTGRPVADFDALAAGDYTVRALARLGADSVVDVLVPIRVTGKTAITVELSRACRGVVCPTPGSDLTACLHGACVEPACVIGRGAACGAPTDAGVGPSDGGASCDDGTPDALDSVRCNDCYLCSQAGGTCRPTWDLCTASTECLAYNDCVQGCYDGVMPDPESCAGECAMTYAHGFELLNDALACTVCTECAQN